MSVVAIATRILSARARDVVVRRTALSDRSLLLLRVRLAHLGPNGQPNLPDQLRTGNRDRQTTPQKADTGTLPSVPGALARSSVVISGSGSGSRASPKFDPDCDTDSDVEPPAESPRHSPVPESARRRHHRRLKRSGSRLVHGLVRIRLFSRQGAKTAKESPFQFSSSAFSAPLRESFFLSSNVTITGGNRGEQDLPPGGWTCSVFFSSLGRHGLRKPSLQLNDSWAWINMALGNQRFLL